jgi:hypothetical protein
VKKQDNSFETAVRSALKGREIPILVLDTRWHRLFPQGEKPADIEALEERLNDLLKKQGRLVNEIKDLKKAKKKLMDSIVAGMEGSSARDNRKKENQQRLLLETKDRIQQDSDELMEIPYDIKDTNEKLMIIGARYCFERLSNGDQMIQELTEEIRTLQAELTDKKEFRENLEESMDSAYSLMHGLLGHDIMNLFDKGKFRP